MRTILVLNGKGGCGKTTIATNLASYYATQGQKIVLADFDPQRSSLEWLQVRSSDRPEIIGLDAINDPLRVARDTEIFVMDVQAGVHGKDLAAMVRRADTIIVPILPSPFDIRAAARFIQDLRSMGRITREQSKLAVIANRARENTVVYHKLAVFLKSLKIPFLTTLRDTQNYIRAAENGLGIFELAPSSVGPDLEQWKPITKWLASKRSMPK